jgi:hypothetical protein
MLTCFPRGTIAEVDYREVARMPGGRGAPTANEWDNYSSVFLADDEGGEGSTDKRNEQRKRRRKERNGRIAQLDAAVQATMAATGQVDGAASAKLDGRAPNGRAFHLVLADVIRCLTHLHEQNTAGAQSGASAGVDVNVDFLQGATSASPSLDFRDGLLCCAGMLCFEVEVPSWKIQHVGIGAQRFLEDSPWGDYAGQTLSHFIHTLDAEAFEGSRV